MSSVKNVLAIDDDPVALLIVSKTIAKVKFADSVIEMGGAGVALKYLEELINGSGEDVPELIILDLNMPILDGWGFLDTYEDALMNQFPKTHIIILSSSIDPSERVKAKKYTSVIGFYSKPLTEQALEEIDHLINSN